MANKARGKTVVVLSGGTAAAWEICKAFRKIGGEKIRLIVCDINPPFLVHSSTISDKFIQVLPISTAGYYECILKLLDDYSADIIIPIIDFDLQYFSRDNPDLQERGIFSTAPESSAFNLLANKENLNSTMSELNILSPQLYNVGNVEANKEYFVKPKIGFGSKDTKIMLGREIHISEEMGDSVIQELCQKPEISVDIFSTANDVRCICRERVETRAGVCIKARIFYEEEIGRIIQKVASHIQLPEICCAQFMTNSMGKLALTDFNLRFGAGGAMSSAVGFRAAEWAVAVWLGLREKRSYHISLEEHYVVRCYTELVTK